MAHSQREVLEDIPESKEGEADEEAESSPDLGDKGDKSVIVNLKIEWWHKNRWYLLSTKSNDIHFTSSFTLTATEP